VLFRENLKEYLIATPVIREGRINMNRRRIEASEIFSLPESTSLDTMMGIYPGSVEASMLDQGGDLYLRIASSKSKDVEMTEEDIQEKIKEWKTHTKENATNAGFRKAHKGRGSMDPRRFALQLAEVARLNASRHGSPSLLKLAKRLRWVAGQERGVAARALARIAAPLEEEARRRDQAGMPFIQKPPDQSVPPASEFNEESRLTPGEPIEYEQDQSWRSRESGRVAKEKEIDEELVTMARDFLQDYKSRNSLYDDDLLDQLNDPDVFESWLLDLDSKGVSPDSGQLDEAWNQAMGEIAEGSGESLEEELGEGDLTPISATRGGETIQRETAPGGDWFNTIINLNESPVMDRYLRTMKDKREGRSRIGRKIEVEDEIADAVDQCLDNFSGDMLPGEISSDHVRKFIEDEFPDVDWKKVYEAIQKIADPKKRHEDDPKERTNQEASRRKPVPVKRTLNPVKIDHRGGRESGLKRYREICACCRGTGEKGERCCGQCRGSGQTKVSAFDEDLDRKEKVEARLGSLLVVSVDLGNRGVSEEGRRELSRLTGSRVAGKGPLKVFRHSTELMNILIENNIPYRTVSYQHPRYKR
jgi:hypothetical protein